MHCTEGDIIGKEEVLTELFTRSSVLTGSSRKL
jgi:hypothetical protein